MEILLEVGKLRKLRAILLEGLPGAPLPDPQSLISTHQRLLETKLAFDLQELSPTQGLTLIFDKDRQVLRVDKGVHTASALAWATFNDSIKETGWSSLHVETPQEQFATNDVTMYAAGIAEGLLTSSRLSEYYSNFQALLLQTASTQDQATALNTARQALTSDFSFLQDTVLGVGDQRKFAVDKEDVYWKQARYLLYQLWGLNDGYNLAAAAFNQPALEFEDFLLLNAGGQLRQLVEAMTPKAPTPGTSFLQRSRAPAGSVTVQEVQRISQSSGFVRLLQDNSDIFVGHSTRSDYSKMTRIFKYYKFPLPGAGTAGRTIAFSSYPGAVTSTDDFYAMDSGLSVMQASLEVLNKEAWNRLFANLKPRIPSFVHIMATNRLAQTAGEWSRIFESGNPGTFNAQWMVVDYNRLKAGESPKSNCFWVVESVPGSTMLKDMTSTLLEKKIWTSMNRPYFNETRAANGFEAAEAAQGDFYSATMNPRAQILSSLGETCNALYAVRNVMGLDIYPPDGTMTKVPGDEVMARMDLSASLPLGGIDTKVTSRCLMKKLQVQAQSGPGHMTLDPFSWTKNGTEVFKGHPHTGQPDLWNFTFVQMSPDGIQPIVDVQSC